MRSRFFVAAVLMVLFGLTSVASADDKAPLFGIAGSVRPGPGAAPAPPDRHTLGVGGRAGGFTLGMGASIRYWSTGRVGFEVSVSHFSIGAVSSVPGVVTTAKMGVVQLAPAVVVSLSRVASSRNPRIRPYAGGGVNIFRSSLTATGSGLGETVAESSSSNDIGFQGFAGAEFVFKGAPRLGVSGEFGYYSTGTPAAGYSFGGLEAEGD